MAHNIDSSWRPPQPQKTSPWSVVGFVLAFLVPPVGVVVSIAAFISAKRRHRLGEGLAVAGIVIGVVLTLIAVPVLLFLVKFGLFQGNDAEDALKPINVEIRRLGGTKLCTNGDAGYGMDNNQPWYQIYYKIPATAGLTHDIETIAAAHGYTLERDVDLIEQLQSGSNRREEFNPKSDYLVARQQGRELRVIVNRETSVSLRCGVKGYGRKRPTGPSEAIVDLHLDFPPN